MLGTLGGPELLLILVVALIVFGPRKLPEIGKSVGKMLHEFRKASNDFQRTIQDEVENEQRREALPATAGAAATATAAAAPAVTPETPATAPAAPTAPVIAPPEGETVSRTTSVDSGSVEPK